MQAILAYGMLSVSHYNLKENNPATEEKIRVRAKYAARFKPDAELKERVNTRCGFLAAVQAENVGMRIATA